MTKDIYIRLRDGEKESELRMERIKQEHQLSLIDGLFKFFDIDVDFKEMAQIYHRSGRAYKEFYDKQDSSIDYADELPAVPGLRTNSKSNGSTVKEQYEIALKDQMSMDFDSEEKDEKLHNNSSSKSVPDHFITGIKYDGAKPLYKCRYKCKCGDESNHYIKKGTKNISCWNCGKVLKVQAATSFGDPDSSKDPEMYRDQYGNFFVAGLFEPDIVTMSSGGRE